MKKLYVTLTDETYSLLDSYVSAASPFSLCVTKSSITDLALREFITKNKIKKSPSSISFDCDGTFLVSDKELL